MPQKRKRQKHVSRHKNIEARLVYTFRWRQINVIIDKILLFRFLRRLHGRFWGIGAVGVMYAGIGICYAIKPDNFHISIALSEFGNDVRTAPYFAGTMFFSAYGLWRWRNYLSRTLRRSRPIVGLLTLTILGFYLVALMPVSWKPWPYRLHHLGVTLIGLSIAATVILDMVLTKARRNYHIALARSIRAVSFALIAGGGYITVGSMYDVQWFGLSLLGEMMMISGYALWIIMKTYLGEGSRSFISRQLKKIVLVD